MSVLWGAVTGAVVVLSVSSVEQLWFLQCHTEWVVSHCSVSALSEDWASFQLEQHIRPFTIAIFMQLLIQSLLGYAHLLQSMHRAHVWNYLQDVLVSVSMNVSGNPLRVAPGTDAEQRIARGIVGALCTAAPQGPEGCCGGLHFTCIFPEVFYFCTEGSKIFSFG